jgi:hypothetical protein
VSLSTTIALFACGGSSELYQAPSVDASNETITPSSDSDTDQQIADLKLQLADLQAKLNTISEQEAGVDYRATIEYLNEQIVILRSQVATLTAKTNPVGLPGLDNVSYTTTTVYYDKFLKSYCTPMLTVDGWKCNVGSFYTNNYFTPGYYVDSFCLSSVAMTTNEGHENQLYYRSENKYVSFNDSNSLVSEVYLVSNKLTPTPATYYIWSGGNCVSANTPSNYTFYQIDKTKNYLSDLVCLPDPPH